MSFYACFACLQSNKGFYSKLKHNCICCNHTSNNTEPSQETPITRVGGTTAPAGSDNNAGLTSFGGDNDDGFNFDTDEVHASVPETSKDDVKLPSDADGAVAMNDAVSSSKETSAAASDKAGSTSLVGDNNGGFDPNSTDKQQRHHIFSSGGGKSRHVVN